MKLQEYIVGDQLMVPFFGVSEVVDFESESLLGQQLSFYHLRPAGMQLTLKVPAQELENRGIRPLASPSRLAEVLEEEAREVELEWRYAHERVARWKELLRSGEEGCRKRLLTAMDGLEKEGARLTPVEKELRERARLSFRSELEFVLGIPTSHAGRLVNESIQA